MLVPYSKHGRITIVPDTSNGLQNDIGNYFGLGIKLSEEYRTQYYGCFPYSILIDAPNLLQIRSPLKGPHFVHDISFEVYLRCDGSHYPRNLGPQYVAQVYR